MDICRSGLTKWRRDCSISMEKWWFRGEVFFVNDDVICEQQVTFSKGYVAVSLLWQLIRDWPGSWCRSPWKRRWRSEWRWGREPGEPWRSIPWRRLSRWCPRLVATSGPDRTVSVDDEVLSAAHNGWKLGRRRHPPSRSLCGLLVRKWRTLRPRGLRPGWPMNLWRLSLKESWVVELRRIQSFVFVLLWTVPFWVQLPSLCGSCTQTFPSSLRSMTPPFFFCLHMFLFSPISLPFFAMFYYYKVHE